MVCVCVFTSVADLQVDGEDGVGAGGVFVHQREAHRPVPPALLYDSLTLSHAVHSVHGEVAHIHPTLWVLFQLGIHQPQQKHAHNQKHLHLQENHINPVLLSHHGNFYSIVLKK